jgi:hypothetical protein
LAGLSGVRELTNLEISDFLLRHPDVADMVGWDDSLLVYPADGLAVLDPSGRYVLVWKDASARWHYVDLSTMPEMQSIAQAINAPLFISDADLLGLIHEQLLGIGSVTVSFIIPALIIGAAIYFGRGRA